ncbi:caspase family protein [Nonomuraea cavernae]|uniref:caspase family protein n=1 Tax=Nonomuraea cavernae TaxID=2045107 RepID=UPI0034084DB8
MVPQTPRRRALCLSVPEARGREPLEFAGALAARMAGVLRRFGFDYATPAPATAAELGDAVFAEIEACGPGDLLVVAIVGHGELTRTGDLHVVGPDGKAPRQTRVVDWVKEAENPADGPRVLFLVDVCHAGTAARSPHQLNLETPARATVLAACAPRNAAFDGLFTRAAASVLDEMSRGLRHIPPANEYISLSTLHADIRDQLDRLITELDAAPQEMMSSLVEFRSAADVPPFFRNPDYDPDRAAATEQAADRAFGGFLAEVAAIDPRHYERRAAGHDRTAQAGCFTGRADELAALAAWLDGAGDGPLRVVTGSPGTGKSALLGVLACAAHPELRRRTERIWTRAAHRPAENARLAIAHARQLGTGEIFAALAAQLRLPAPRTPWTRESFGEALEDRPTLLVDALDEASHPAELAADLLALVQRGRCRLLAGMRPWPEFAALRRAAEDTGGLVDLDDEDRAEVQRNIRQYVEAVLELTEPYNSVRFVPARRAYARAVAETLAADPPKDADRWGEFLVAGLCTHRFAARRVPVANAVVARALGLGTPRTLPEVMDLDLADRPEVGAVLTAVAHARGDGMPVEVVRALGALSGPAMAEAEVRAALSAARFYLRQSVEEDGTTVLYRLFHQGLIDHLRASGRDAEILDLLAPAGPEMDWAAAPAYVRRHAVHHADGASRIAELLARPEFLVHTDPVTTLPLLAALPDPPVGAHVYRASAARHAVAGPGVRRQILAVDAARFGEHAMAAELSRGSGWAPAWATGIAVSPALRMTIAAGGTRHTLDAFGLDGRHVLAISCDEGPVRLWDLETGRRTGPPAGFGGEVTAVRAVPWAGRTALVTGHGDGAIRVWEPATGERIELSAPRHAGRVSALAVAEIGGVSAVVSTGTDDHCRVWRPGAEIGVVRVGADGHRQVRTPGSGPPLTGALAPGGPGGSGGSVACAAVNGPVAVTTDGAGTARLWSLETGRSLGILRVAGAPFADVTCVSAAGSAHAVLRARDGRLWAWNLVDGDHRPLPGPGASAALPAPGPEADFAGDDTGALHSVDLGLGRPAWNVAAHAGPVTALARTWIADRPVIVSAGRDGRVRLWNADVASASPDRGWAPITGLATGEGVLAALTGDVLHLYASATGMPLGRHAVRPRSQLAAAADGRHVISYAPSGPLTLWTGAGRAGFQRTGPATDVAAGPEILASGRLGETGVLACGSRTRGVVEIVSVATGLRLSTHEIGRAPVRDLDVHTMGNRTCLIVVDEPGTAWVVDLASGNPVPHRLSGAHGVRAARGVRVDDRHLVVTVADDGSIRGWDLRNAAPLHQAAERHESAATSLACAALGGRPVAITGSEDATVAFWDLRTWRRTGSYALPEAVQRVTVTPEGNVAVAMRAELVVLHYRF